MLNELDNTVDLGLFKVCGCVIVVQVPTNLRKDYFALKIMKMFVGNQGFCFGDNIFSLI